MNLLQTLEAEQMKAVRAKPLPDFRPGAPIDATGKTARAFRLRSNYSILFLAMTKRKPAKFSATKAVKANARERVGQPKPARVLATEPRTGRETKHKPRLDELIRQED